MKTLFAPIAAQLQQLRQDQDVAALAHIFGPTTEERVAAYQEALSYDRKIQNILAELANNSREALSTLNARTFNTTAAAADYFIDAIAQADSMGTACLTASSQGAVDSDETGPVFIIKDVDVFWELAGNLGIGNRKHYAKRVEKQGLGGEDTLQFPNPNPLAGWSEEKILAQYPWPYGDHNSLLRVGKSDGPVLRLLSIRAEQEELDSRRWNWVVEIIRIA